MNISTRKKLLEEADLELIEIRKKISNHDMVAEGFWEKIKNLKNKLSQTRDSKDIVNTKTSTHSNRWGSQIVDPDISWQDYKKMRQLDPTLPKIDPREFRDLKVRYKLEPWSKWLYFSKDYGSYEQRLKNIGKPEVVSKLYPGYWPDKMNELPQDAIQIFDNKKEYEGLFAKILWMLSGLLP